jgi:hypothetical protein
MAPLTTAVAAVGLTAATIGLSWQGVKANVLAMPLLPCQPAESRLGGRKLHGGLGRTITRALALLTYEFEAAAVTGTRVLSRAATVRGYVSGLVAGLERRNGWTLA